MEFIGAVIFDAIIIALVAIPIVGLISLIKDHKKREKKEEVFDPYLERIKKIRIYGTYFKNKQTAELEDFVLNYDAQAKSHGDYYRILVDSFILNDEHCGSIDKFEVFDENDNIISLKNYSIHQETSLSGFDMVNICIYKNTKFR